MQQQRQSREATRDFLLEELRHARTRAAYFSRALPGASREAFREAQAQLDRIANAWADALDRFERNETTQTGARIIPFPVRRPDLGGVRRLG